MHSKRCWVVLTQFKTFQDIFKFCSTAANTTYPLSGDILKLLLVLKKVVANKWD